MNSAPPLQAILPAYPYQQYVDDPNIVAFFTALNELAGPYLDWFNNTPLAVYTSPNVSGPLLDWIGQGIYGIARPVFSSQTTKFVAGVNATPINTVGVDDSTLYRSGTAVLANDDYYKRVLTWWLYAGNGGNGGGVGRYFNVEVLRLKVARFLYGVNGTDVTLSQAQTVSIQPQLLPSPARPTLSQTAGGSFAARTYGAWVSYVSPDGETLVGPPSSLTVGANNLLVVASPAPANGAIAYNVYVDILSVNPNYKAGIDALAVNAFPVDGSNKKPVAAPTKQNSTPIPIGTPWTEPSSGLIVGSPLPTSNTSNVPGGFIITVPAGLASTYLQQALENNILAFPFVFSATVIT